MAITINGPYSTGTTGLYGASVTFLNNNTFIVSYYDLVNSNGKVRVGTITNGTISYGSEYVFNTGETQNMHIKKISGNKFIIVYRDDGNNYYGTARIGTVSGQEITLGNKYVFESTTTNYMSMDVLSETSCILTFQEYNGYLKALIVTISGVELTFNTEYSVSNFSGSYGLDVCVLSQTKAIISFSKDSSGYGTSIIATISGTAISLGDEYTFNSAITTYICTTKLSENKVLISYEDYGGSHYGESYVATISGTAISFGTKGTFNYSATKNIGQISNDESVVVIFYKDDGGDGYIHYKTCTISDTSVSYGVEQTFYSYKTHSSYDYVAISSNKNLVIGLVNHDNSTGEVYCFAGATIPIFSALPCFYKN